MRRPVDPVFRLGLLALCFVVLGSAAIAVQSASDGASWMMADTGDTSGDDTGDREALGPLLFDIILWTLRKVTVVLISLRSPHLPTQ